MAWEVWWALVLGFLLSGIVQAWVPRTQMARAWQEVARNFMHDWKMLWKEIIGGFLIAGFIALLPLRVFNDLFLTHTGGAGQLAGERSRGAPRRGRGPRAAGAEAAAHPAH